MPERRCAMMIIFSLSEPVSVASTRRALPCPWSTSATRPTRRTRAPGSRCAVSAPTWRNSGRWWAGQRRGEEITCKIIYMEKFPTTMRVMLPTGPPPASWNCRIWLSAPGWTGRGRGTPSQSRSCSRGSSPPTLTTWSAGWYLAWCAAAAPSSGWDGLLLGPQQGPRHRAVNET